MASRVVAETKRTRDDRFLRIRELRRSGDCSGLLGELDAATEVGDDEAVTAVVRAIGHVCDPRASGRMLPLLRHPTPKVRRATARVLGKLKGEEATAGLVSALGDTDLSTACWAAHGLGAIGSPEATPHLVAALERPKVRRAAAAALAQLGAREAIDPLTATLAESNWYTRRKVRRAIRYIEEHPSPQST